MTVRQYSEKHREISGDILTRMSSADVFMSMIIGRYFAKKDKEDDLTSVFTNFVDFEVKRRILQRVIKGTPAFQKYLKIPSNIKKMQEIRNKFAHCPPYYNVHTLRTRIEDLKEISLLEYPKLNESHRTITYKYSIDGHKENVMLMTEIAAALQSILDTMQENGGEDNNPPRK